MELTPSTPKKNHRTEKEEYKAKKRYQGIDLTDSSLLLYLRLSFFFVPSVQLWSIHLENIGRMFCTKESFMTETENQSHNGDKTSSIVPSLLSDLQQKLFITSHAQLWSIHLKTLKNVLHQRCMHDWYREQISKMVTWIKD